MKVLFLDIETTAVLGWCWGVWEQNINPSNVVRRKRMMCFAAKWQGSDETLFYAEWDSKHEMLVAFHALLDEADVVVHYNGKKFDIPMIQQEFLRAKMGPPSPYRQIDLLQTTRSQFKFLHNKLDYVSQELGLGQKTDHEGMPLWLKCMNDPVDPYPKAEVAAARAVMEDYNRNDVILTEDYHDEILPWIKNYPNRGVYVEGGEDDMVCRNCGGSDLQKRGTQATNMRLYQRYRCNDCGTWGRGNRCLKQQRKGLVS